MYLPFLSCPQQRIFGKVEPPFLKGWGWGWGGGGGSGKGKKGGQLMTDKWDSGSRGYIAC